MFFFAERMKALVDDLRLSKKDRAAAISRLKDQTEFLLGEARSFLGQLDQGHLAMATHLRCTLAAHNQARREQVQEVRQAHFQERRAMRDRLRDMLFQTKKTRHDHLRHLRGSFRLNQRVLAEDFRRSAKAWRQLGSSGKK